MKNKSKKSPLKFSATICLLLLSFSITVFNQTPTPTATATPQEIDPEVKEFVDKFNRVSSVINAGTDLLNEGNLEAENKYLEALEYVRDLYQKSFNEKIAKALSQTDAEINDYRLLLKLNENTLLGALGNFYRYTRNFEKSLEYTKNQRKLLSEIRSDKEFM